MAADYSAQLTTVNRLMTAKGVVVEYFKPNYAVGDAAWFPTTLTADAYNPVMLSTNSGVVRYFKFKISPIEDRPYGSLSLLMPGNCGFIPTYRDAFNWSDGDASTLWYVHNIDMLAPAATPLLYYIEASK